MKVEEKVYQRNYIKQIARQVKEIISDTESLYKKQKHLYENLTLTAQNLDVEIEEQKRIEQLRG